ncbi:beta-glucuronidase [Colletotrichum costaricense]|uniref:Beta-glucuronidase n=1 Tax=Colletotrichum costaricense TaxID=1209916 RepID=A0AAI9ZAV7_9PEZI|nr:beta-glucuronidase [Colletotrichum costaricense]KAK1539137.1 beta-glucuronidase [Colletotrichum costaricense]
MLKPQANSTRDIVSLDGIWNFAIASSPDIEADAPWSKLIPPKLQVPVPASYNDIFADEKIRSHVGWVYYQRQVTVPRGWSPENQRYFLRFDAATHRGRVYVNDKLVADHVGGYTPFEADITSIIKPGKRFRLTVAVSNELSWETIPPGKIQTLANGKRKQNYQHDFFNYSGLARSVYLCSKPAVSIIDITVVTDIFESRAGKVQYKVETSQPVEDDKVKISVLDEEGLTVSQANGTKDELTINSAHLWQPGAAYLYQLRVEILSDSDKDEVLDTYELPFGIRTISVKGNQFLINGKPFYFTGFGKHEDSPIRGKGFDPAYMIHDFHLMRWMGANSFRTAHYPYAEEVLDYADRHGIVVINETPAVGINLGIIAGVFGLKAPPTFAPDACNEKTQAAHDQAIRELVARDKNHPSVVMWTVTNEPASAEPGAREYLEPLVSLTRELDPTRPVCFANMGFATFEKDLVTDLFDVICLNRYYGWYSQTGDLEEAEQVLEKDLLGWQAKYGKPMIMTEYGAEAVAGLHAVCDVPWSEEYQGKFLEMFHRVFDRVETVVGEHVWNFADFQTTSRAAEAPRILSQAQDYKNSSTQVHERAVIDWFYISTLALFQLQSSTVNMARLPYPDVNGTPLNISKLLAHSPATVNHWSKIAGAHFKDLELSSKNRELVILLSTAKFRSTYEWTHHSTVSAKEGVTDAQREVIAQAGRQKGYFSSQGKLESLAELFTSKEKALLLFIEAVIDGPEVADELWTKAKTEFSDREVVEMITLQGFYYTFSRLTTVLNVELEPFAKPSKL